MRRAVAALAVCLSASLAACSPGPPDATGRRSTPDAASGVRPSASPHDAGAGDVAGGALQIVAVASDPAPEDRSGDVWTFPAAVRAVDLTVTLRGTGTFTAAVTVVADPGGAPVHEDRRTVDLDGELYTMRFADVRIPRRGTYRLVVEALGAGIQQRSEISVTVG